MKYTTRNTVLEIVQPFYGPRAMSRGETALRKWRMRLRDKATGRVLSTRAEHDNDELVNVYFKRGRDAMHSVYVKYINSKGKTMTANPRKFMKGRGKQWQGTDRDLETSLFEYGFVAVQLPDRDYPDEWFVVYDFGNHKQFGTGHIREKELDDLVSGKEWATKKDVAGLLDSLGVDTVAQWKDALFVLKFSDLMGYWGIENILGSDYYPLNLKNLIRLSMNLEKKYGPEYLL
jgi:hypothetical protein